MRAAAACAPPSGARARRPGRRTASSRFHCKPATRTSFVLLLGGALERAAGLGEEDIVERRLVQLQLLDLEVLAVERADDSGQVGLTGAKPHRDAALGAARVAEAGEDRLDPLAVVGAGGNRLDRRTADARLQLVGRPLGHDL